MLVAHCATGFQLCRPSAGMQISTRVTCARRIKRTFFSLRNYWGTTAPLTMYVRLSTQHGYGRGSRREYSPFHCLLGSSHSSEYLCTSTKNSRPVGRSAANNSVAISFDKPKTAQELETETESGGHWRVCFRDTVNINRTKYFLTVATV